MILRLLINKSAQFFKGNDYHIDERISTKVLIFFSVRRILGLLRCVLRGVKISIRPRDLVFLGPRVRLRNRQMIRFGSGVTLGEGVIIDGLSENGIELGDNVSIGPFSIIEATGVISDLGKGFIMGANSGMGAFSFVGAAGGVYIGNNVIMGQRISFHSEDHIFSNRQTLIRKQGVTRQGIIVEDDCWVGANVVFLDGAHVKNGCVIAAGAVVKGHIPEYSVAAGVPAKVVKTRE